MNSSSNILSALLAVDEQADRAELHAFADALGVPSLTRFAWCIRQHTEGLGESELIKLIKVFTRLELCVPGFCGGSTEQVSTLLHELERRDPAVAEELAAWAFHTTRNLYVPFGTQNAFRARANSIAELRRLSRARRDEVTEVEAARSALAAKRMQERRVAHEQRLEQHRAACAQRDSEVLAMQYVAPAQRLRHVADDLTRSPYYYPEAWADVSAEVVGELSVDHIARLRQRLNHPPKGPWRSLSRQLSGRRSGRTGSNEGN